MRPSRLLCLIVPLFVAVCLGLMVGAPNGRADERTEVKPAAKPVRVLVFSGTGWYRHPDIPRTNGWLARLGQEQGFVVDVTETPADLTAERLAEHRVLVLNNANELDKVLDDHQKRAVEAWSRGGGGIVGLHAALVHQTAWSWLSQLGGADFDSDSDFARARVIVDPAAKGHPAVSGQGAEFWYSADWHNHDRSVSGRPGFHVLMRLDESTYEPVRPYFKERGGKRMGKDHPAAWIHEAGPGGGRFFYTDLGHDLRSLDTPFGRRHIASAVHWAAGE
jgi:type 1 glutamine amidotransferase